MATASLLPFSSPVPHHRSYSWASTAPRCVTAGGSNRTARRRAGLRIRAEDAADASLTVPARDKYTADDCLVKKVSAMEVRELVKGERTVPLIVDFHANWCGPCVLMAQELEMLAVEYENNALFVKVDADDEHELAHDMQVRGLPTLYFFSPDPSKDAIRTEGLVPKEMIKNILDNEM